MIKIKHVINGYIVDTDGEETIHVTLDEVFNKLLIHFEGRASSFTGNAFGIVSIQRGKK